MKQFLTPLTYLPDETYICTGKERQRKIYLPAAIPKAIFAFSTCLLFLILCLTYGEAQQLLNDTFLTTVVH